MISAQYIISYFISHFLFINRYLLSLDRKSGFIHATSNHNIQFVHATI